MLSMLYSSYLTFGLLIEAEGNFDNENWKLVFSLEFISRQTTGQRPNSFPINRGTLSILKYLELQQSRFVFDWSRFNLLVPYKPEKSNFISLPVKQPIQY